MIKKFLIELRDYLYALKYASILTKALNLITIKNNFLLCVFITRYLLHSLKCIFCKNLDDKKMGKKWERFEQQNSVQCRTCYIYIVYLWDAYTFIFLFMLQINKIKTSYIFTLSSTAFRLSSLRTISEVR